MRRCLVVSNNAYHNDHYTQLSAHCPAIFIMAATRFAECAERITALMTQSNLQDLQVGAEGTESLLSLVTRWFQSEFQNNHKKPFVCEESHKEAYSGGYRWAFGGNLTSAEVRPTCAEAQHGNFSGPGGSQLQLQNCNIFVPVRKTAGKNQWLCGPVPRPSIQSI